MSEVPEPLANALIVLAIIALAAIAIILTISS
jgi:hypothetical protein